MQLMQVKHERLLVFPFLSVCCFLHFSQMPTLYYLIYFSFQKQVELLRTGVRESQMLKLNCAKHHSVSAEKDTKLGANSCSVTFVDNLEVPSSVVRYESIHYALCCYKGFRWPLSALFYCGFSSFLNQIHTGLGLYASRFSF